MARFVDGFKQLNGIAAGAFDMPWKIFALFNAIGAALWVAFFGFGTLYLDKHIGRVRIFLEHLNPWFAGGTGVGLLLVLWLFFAPRQRRGRKA